MVSGNVLRRVLLHGRFIRSVLTVIACRSIHTWKSLNEKMHWGILLLIGAGFAMADGSDASGFSTWVAKILADLVGDLQKWAIVLVVTIVAALFTEICSNTAAASLFIPILGALSKELCLHPLSLLMPAVLACSLSFMLPGTSKHKL